MHLIYIDDSQDPPLYCFSALVVPADQWLDTFRQVKQWRRGLRESDGIFITKEFHAWKFVSGRGQISDRVVPKGRRCQIFHDSLGFIAGLTSLRLFNVCLQDRQDWAFERLLNRINRTMQAWGSHALVICDEGKEADYTRLVRKMSVHNPIPSQFGVWQETGRATRNIPIDRIIEDPFFKKSDKSYFIQLVDFCAYALLRKEKPVASKTRYGLDQAFKRLEPLCVKEACRRDPYGIIR
jgi:hypothetical protein